MKHKTGTKVMSWLLSLALVLSLIPSLALPALAAATVQFAGTAVANETYYKVVDSALTTDGASEDAYNVYLDGDKLTLNGVQYEGDKIAVYSQSALEIHLVGENSLHTKGAQNQHCGIQISGDLTITAVNDGSLDVQCSYIDSINYSPTRQTTAYGISAGGVVLQSGTVYVQCGAMETNANDTYTQNRCAVSSTTLTVQSGAKLTAIGGYCKGTSYGVKVGSNGDGSLTVDGTLYANTKNGNSYLCGEAVSSLGIWCGTLTSSGTIKAFGGIATNGSYGIQSKKINITGGTIIAAGGSSSSTDVREFRSCGLYTYGGAFDDNNTITDATVTLSGGESHNESVGFYYDTYAPLTITNSTLTATGGKVIGSANAAEAGSYGIRHSRNQTGQAFTIDSGEINAIGGEAINADSAGFLSYKDTGYFQINGGRVTATGGKATGTTKLGSKSSSIGFSAAERLYVNGGSLTATGGDADGASRGLFVYYSPYGMTVNSDSATVTASGGKGEESIGIYTAVKDNSSMTTISKGKVTAIGGEASQRSLGIHGYITINDNGDVTAIGGTGIDSYGLNGSVFIDGASALFQGGTATTGNSYGINYSYGLSIKNGGVLISRGGEASQGNSYGLYHDSNIDSSTFNVTLCSATFQGYTQAVYCTNNNSACPVDKKLGAIVSTSYDGTVEPQYLASSDGFYGFSIPKDKKFAQIGQLYEFTGYTQESDNVITATCTNLQNETYSPPNNKATLTIDAPLHKRIGDGKSPAAQINDPALMRGTAQVEYYNANGNERGDELNAAPVDTVGDYWAEITLGGVTAHVVYSISEGKTEPPTYTAPTAKPDLTSTGADQPLVNGGTVTGGTMQYALGDNGTDAPTSGWGEGVPTGNNAGTYYVWYKVVGDEDHVDVAPDCITVIIWNVPSVAPTAVPSENIESTDTTIIIKKPTNPAQEYIVVPNDTAPENYDWTKGKQGSEDEDLVFDGLTPSTPYKVVTRTREAAEPTPTHASDPSTPTTVSTRPSAPTADLPTTTDTTTTQNTIVVKPVVDTYEYIVVKGDVTVPTGEWTHGKKGAESTGDPKTLTFDKDSNGDPLTPYTEYQVCARIPQTNDTPASAAAKVGPVKTQSDPATAPTITAQPKNLTLKEGYTAGNVLTVGVNAAAGHTLSYQWYKNTAKSAEGGTAITGATAVSYTIPTGKAKGVTEYYYCVITATHNDQTAAATTDAATVTVTDKVLATVETAPAAVENLVYTGDNENHQLISDGTAVNGVMKYAVGTDAAPTESWSSEIPTRANAGTYYVWYKAEGSGDYSDSEAQRVKVTIAKAEQDALDAPTEESKTGSSVTLTATDGCEYRRGAEGEWQDSPTFGGLTPNTDYTFYQRRKGDNNHNPSAASAGITIKTAEYTALNENNKPTITNQSGHSTPQVGDVLTAATEATVDSYDWLRRKPISGGEPIIEVIVLGSNAPYTVSSEDVGWQIVAAANQTMDADGTKLTEKRVVCSEPTSEVEKKNGAAATAVKTEEIIKNGTSITIDPTNKKYEYIVVSTGSTPGEDDWKKDAKPGTGGPLTFDGLTPNTSYDILTRVKETQASKPGEAAKTSGILTTQVTVTLNPAQPTAGQPVTATLSPANDGATYEWYLDGEPITPTPGDSYTPTDADKGKTLKLVVKLGGSVIGETAADGPVTEPEKHTVSGVIYKNNGTPAAGAAVKLTSGKEVIETTNADENGKYVFTVGGGTYNLVATVDGVTKTELVELSASRKCNLTMPVGNTNSELQVKGTGTPAVVVGGLDEEAESVKEMDDPTNKQNVTVTLTVEEKAETAAALSEVTAIKTEAGSKTLDYLDIKMEKNVGGAKTAISSTANLLSIVVPYDFSGKKNVTVYRYHGNAAETLAPGEGADGTFQASPTLGSITIYTSKFSTYAIGYTASTGGGTTSSGGSSSGTYSISVSTPAHGTVKTDPSSARSGDQVTITLKPDEGYEVDQLTVTDASGNKLNVTDKGNGEYTFVMPKSKITVNVTYKLHESAAQTDCPKDESCPISAFNDASATAWYHDGVHFVLENGIMRGYGNGKFGPADTTSRAMMAQILWNLEGKPEVSFTLSYTDLGTDAWYTEAVRWASAQGIMDGYGNGKFGPNDAMTREQLVTIVYRYAKYKGIDVSAGENTNILSYADAQNVSQWAIPAMQWAVGSGLITGRTASTLNPGDNASRAEIATIMMRYCTETAQ
jgi:hypothetical protein